MTVRRGDIDRQRDAVFLNGDLDLDAADLLAAIDAAVKTARRPATGATVDAPIARHCVPQKQTHQVAITVLRSVVPASGGFGPDRIGRAPSLAMAASSATTSSTNTSTSANASMARAMSWRDGRWFPWSDLDAVDDGLRDGLSSFRTPHTIQPSVAIASPASTTVGVSLP